MLPDQVQWGCSSLVIFNSATAVFSADIQFEEANPSNFTQLNNLSQLSVSSGSLAGKPTSNSSGYTSSVDLINLDLMGPPSTQSNTHDFAIPSADSSGFGTGVATTSSLAYNSASTIASSSGSTLRKEGKTLNTVLLRHAHRHAKPHSTAYELSKANHTLKEKRSAYSSRYALSLMDLFTSSNTPSASVGSSSSKGGSSRAINRCPPSYTAQANAIISHVPVCTVSTSLSTCKSVSIDHRVTTFGNVAPLMLPSLTAAHELHSRLGRSHTASSSSSSYSHQSPLTILFFSLSRKHQGAVVCWGWWWY